MAPCTPHTNRDTSCPSRDEVGGLSVRRIKDTHQWSQSAYICLAPEAQTVLERTNTGYRNA